MNMSQIGLSCCFQVPDIVKLSGSVLWYTTVLVPSPCCAAVSDRKSCSGGFSSLTVESLDATPDLFRLAKKQELGEAVKVALLASVKMKRSHLTGLKTFAYTLKHLGLVSFLCLGNKYFYSARIH